MVGTVDGDGFPFLFGGTFIEGKETRVLADRVTTFPFLFGGTFIEGLVSSSKISWSDTDFPSFSEGLSLRV